MCDEDRITPLPYPYRVTVRTIQFVPRTQPDGPADAFLHRAGFDAGPVGSHLIDRLEWLDADRHIDPRGSKVRARPGRYPLPLAECGARLDDPTEAKRGRRGVEAF